MGDYVRRVIDAELDELLPGLTATALEGPRAVGKTVTAARRANSVFALDDPVQRKLLAAEPLRIEAVEPPVLVDEWQLYPDIWDTIRRSVDREQVPGRYLLTGSAAPIQAPRHTGAGRIVSLRMRPMSLAERLVAPATVSLRRLLDGDNATIDGETTVGLSQYADEIVRSGFPGIRDLPPKVRRAQLDAYINRIVARDFPEQGRQVRKPQTLRAWLAAYAAATATTASYTSILDAATAGESAKPGKDTTMAYRDVLAQLWLLEPVPAWLPFRNQFTRLGSAPKHHLADPALAARLLGADAGALLDGTVAGSPRVRDGVLLGQLFEALVTLDLQVYAQAAEARLHHLRTRNGDHEVDLIVERADHRIVAVEVKLAQHVEDSDVVHLKWLRDQIGPDLLDAVVITTGPYAYRRPDGIAVVPAALLGP